MTGGHCKVPQIHPRGLHRSVAQPAMSLATHGPTALCQARCLAKKVSWDGCLGKCAALWKQSKTEARDIDSRTRWLSLVVSGLWEVEQSHNLYSPLLL